MSILRGAYVGAFALLAIIVAYMYLFSPMSFSQIVSRMSGDEKGTRVVVVGGGLAGISAAIEASRHGASVTIIEKEKNIGGNSAKATSGINGAGTEAQKAMNILDTVDKFVQDTVSSGDGDSSEVLVRTLGEKSADAHVFLRSFGLNLTDVVQLGGHGMKRTHRFPPTADGKPVPVGFTILGTLRKYVENDLKDSVTILTNSVFKGLLVKEGKVSGVSYTGADGTVDEVSGIVVLAAGGYANDHTDNSLLVKHAPHLAKLPTTNGPWATGDVIKSIQEQDIGAKLIHMDRVQVHPTGFIEPSQPNHHTKFLAPEALRGCGAILLNDKGERFFNELGRRDYVTEGIFKKGFFYEGDPSNPTVAAMLMTQQVIDKFSAPAAGFYKFKGLIQDVKTMAGAAEKLGVKPDVIRNTIVKYNNAAEKGEDEFSKQAFPTRFSENDHYFLSFVTPTLHYCMGGLSINNKAEVVKEDGSSIPGLYAAGEVSGGVHGNNRLGGNSLLECVVFGRTAGTNAAHTDSKI